MITLLVVSILHLTQPIASTEALSRTLVLSFESGSGQGNVISDVLDAVDWWQRLSPIPIHLSVAEKTPQGALATEVVPIYVLASSAESYTDGYHIWIGNDGPFRAATIAHELGHVLFDLPDWYLQPGSCDLIDIMCEPVSAYTSGVVGCRSLNTILSGACRVRRTFLPVLSRVVQ